MTSYYPLLMFYTHSKVSGEKYVKEQTQILISNSWRVVLYKLLEHIFSKILYVFWLMIFTRCNVFSSILTVMSNYVLQKNWLSVNCWQEKYEYPSRSIKIDFFEILSLQYICILVYNWKMNRGNIFKSNCARKV